MPGSVRVRFGLKKGLNMRGYSGSMGASTNIGRSEHISAFKCVQSVCMSGSAYAKSGYLRLCLNTYLTNCANVYVRFCSNMRVWGGILGDFGVFEGKNGRYPPLKIFEGHFSFQGKTTFSVATLGISTYMSFGQSVLQSHHICSGFHYPEEGLAVLGQSTHPALSTLPGRWLLGHGTLWGRSASFDTCPSLIQPGYLQDQTACRRTCQVLDARTALVLANAGCGCL